MRGGPEFSTRTISPFNITVSTPSEDETLLKEIVKLKKSNVLRLILPVNVEGPFIVTLSSQ